MNEMDIKLQQEMIIGGQYRSAWENLVKPFFDAKQVQLFEAFQATESHDVDKLQLIKMQSTVLRSMEVHFMHFIDTGKLAELQLTKNEGEKNGQR